MHAQKSKDAVKDRGDLYDKIRNYFMQRLMEGAIIKQYIPAKTATYMFSALYYLPRYQKRINLVFLDVIILQ